MNNGTYEAYMNQVGLEIQRLSGGAISSHTDLRDSVFTRDNYEDDVSPTETATEILEGDDIWFFIYSLTYDH